MRSCWRKERPWKARRNEAIGIDMKDGGVSSWVSSIWMLDKLKRVDEALDKIRSEMGGADKIDRLHADGLKTIRDHIDAFVDDGSFREF